MLLKRKWIVLISLICLFCSQASISIGQPKPETLNNLFTVWTKLSLIGYTQSEIESSLSHIDPNLLKRVKHRLRVNVIRNLKLMNIKEMLEESTTFHDLNIAKDHINTEVRFAGLENDHPLRIMIREQFGIPLSQI